MLGTALVTGQGLKTGEPTGELLYSTYCIGCHTTQVHWRDQRLATDWTSLKFQVRRWQQNIEPGLDESDVAAMAKYLNGLYYHFVETDTTQSGKALRTRQVVAHRPD